MSEENYYRIIMRDVFGRYMKSTLKMLFHFFVPFFNSDESEITVDNLFNRINSNIPPLLIDNRARLFVAKKKGIPPLPLRINVRSL